VKKSSKGDFRVPPRVGSSWGRHEAPSFTVNAPDDAQSGHARYCINAPREMRSLCCVPTGLRDLKRCSGSCDCFMDFFVDITDLLPTFRIPGVDLYSICRTRDCIVKPHCCYIRATPSSRKGVESVCQRPDVAREPGLNSQEQ
jgi:hypothetical protein